MNRFENPNDITIEEIRRLYDVGSYTADSPSKKKVREDFVFDENQSVKWNREQAIKWNNEVHDELMAYRAKRAEYNNDLINDITIYLANNYTHINFAQGKHIVNWCYNEYHHCMSDFFTMIDYLADFYCDVLKLT